MKANKLLDSQGLCVRRQHDINEHCGVVGDDAERRMFCKSCPPPTIRVNRVAMASDGDAPYDLGSAIDDSTAPTLTYCGRWNGSLTNAGAGLRTPLRLAPSIGPKVSNRKFG